MIRLDEYDPPSEQPPPSRREQAREQGRAGQSLHERVAALERGDAALTDEIGLLRDDVRWLRDRLWVLALGGAVGAVGGSAALDALASTLANWL